MTANLNAIAAIIEAHEPNTVGCTEYPGPPEHEEHDMTESTIRTFAVWPACTCLQNRSQSFPSGFWFSPPSRR